MKKQISIAVLIFCLLLTSCGEKGSSTEITVVLGDFQFQPNDFKVPLGEEISFSGINNGAVVHNFAIMNFGTDAGDSFGADDVQNVYWEVELVPGASIDSTFNAPTTPGEYQIVCSTEGHIASGMIGTLVVLIDE